MKYLEIADFAIPTLLASSLIDICLSIRIEFNKSIISSLLLKLSLRS
nr:MAG TPA: hypothetical protein [Caudoviricetes sp.]